MASSNGSAAPMTLYDLSFGPYPRRVTLYMKEKKLPSNLINIIPVSFDAGGHPIAPGKPTGTVPILAVHPNTAYNPTSSTQYIKQSIPILEYLEDITLDREHPNTTEEDATTTTTQQARYPSLRGRTPFERARIRSILQIQDELTEYSVSVIRWGSKGFAPRAGGAEYQDPKAARLAWKILNERLALLESYCDPLAPEKGTKGAMLVQMQDPQDEVSMADCAVFAFLYFLKLFYGLDFVGKDGKYPRLAAFFEEFMKREGADIGGGFPEGIMGMKEWVEGGELGEEVAKEIN